MHTFLRRGQNTSAMHSHHKMLHVAPGHPAKSLPEAVPRAAAAVARSQGRQAETRRPFPPPGERSCCTTSPSATTLLMSEQHKNEAIRPPREAR